MDRLYGLIESELLVLQNCPITIMIDYYDIKFYMR